MGRLPTLFSILDVYMSIYNSNVSQVTCKPKGSYNLSGFSNMWSPRMRYFFLSSSWQKNHFSDKKINLYYNTITIKLSMTLTKSSKGKNLQNGDLQKPISYYRRNFTGRV